MIRDMGIEVALDGYTSTGVGTRLSRQPGISPPETGRPGTVSGAVRGRAGHRAFARPPRTLNNLAALMRHTDPGQSAISH